MSESLFKSFKRDLLVDKIDRQIAKQALKDNQERTAELLKESAFHPSQITSCLRAVFYAWCGVQCETTKDSFAPKTQRIFSVGNDLHTRYQNYLRNMGRLWGNWTCQRCQERWTGMAGRCPNGHSRLRQTYKEFPVSNSLLRIQGRTDGIVFPDTIPETELPTLRTVLLSKHEKTHLELKSMRSMQFKSIKAPLDKHIWQAAMYMLCTGIELNTFIYEDKDGQDVKQYITIPEKKIVGAITNRIYTFAKCWNAGELPGKHECDPRYCPYEKECMKIKRTAKELLDQRIALLRKLKEEDKIPDGFDLDKIKSLVRQSK